jgi:hypothetical protein
VLPCERRSGRIPHATRTAVDAKLIERTGLDEFSLRRLRKEFISRCSRLTYAEKRALTEGGTVPRFRMMTGTMADMWSGEKHEIWLRYLEHTQQDLAEMCAGEYPISPYLVRVFSALFGIKVDFLLLGTTPCVDRMGANIDVWPLTGIR